MGEALRETSLTGLPVRRGKVRDVYDLGGDRLLFVATDRISAFDWVLPGGIPDKGRVLTGLSVFWFGKAKVAHHLVSTHLDDAGLDLDPATRAALEGRSMIVRKAEVFPYECVVRGYLAGSGWKEYQAFGTVCGEPLPPGLVESSRIDPLFTPATKAETGHDENVPFARMVESLGAETAGALRQASLRLYQDAADYARTRGLILADTKFEFGRDPRTGAITLVDEALTPDSSRYWPADRYEPGGPQPSFDKQFVRDWLETTGWDKASPPPDLPADVVARTREKYVEAYETLTGQPFPWK
ncbi:MAG: phosphoribosylaminoimidazolesuccinocarboxamide synthase [Isosphaeraceae bacterium]